MSAKMGFVGGFVEEIDISRTEVVRRCIALAIIRLGVALVLLALHLAWPDMWTSSVQVDSEPSKPLGIVLWFYAGTAVLFLVATLLAHDKKRMTRFGLAADLAAATAMVVLTGCAASKFVLLYMLIIVGSAVMLSPLTGVTVGIASVSLLSLSQLGESSGWWPWPANAQFSSNPVFGFIAVISFLMLTAFLSGYLGLKSSRLKVLNVELLESISAGIAIVDLDGNIQYLNMTGEALLGVRVDEARGKRAEEVIPTDGKNPFRQTLDNEQPLIRLEVSMMTKRGDVVPAGITTSILRDQTGRMWGVLATFLDLTEAKRIEERLRHADRMATVAQLAAGMGHDIRTPLACIMGAVELLEEIIPDSTETQDVVDIIVRETGRLTGIVENFLDISRISTLRHSRFSFGSLWEEVESVLGTKLQAVKDGRVRLSASWKPTNLSIWADFGQMRQALLNLAQNGVEAMPDGGTVNVLSEVTSRDGRFDGEAGVEIVVQDSGPGIPDDMRDRIFEPFYTSKAKGTGLGLAVVKRIVEGHGGEVRMVETSEAGTAFRIWIPVEDG
jgi:two-component system sensor histidine kinase PilS (NtrC family)